MSAAARRAPATPAPAAPASPWPCLRALPAEPGACVLDLSVQPNAKATQPDGLHDGALRLRLAAPPVDGKANAALCAWLADALGCPRRAVTLLRGESGRRKQLRIERVPAEVAAWLDTLGLPAPVPEAARPAAAPGGAPGRATR